MTARQARRLASLLLFTSLVMAGCSFFGSRVQPKQGTPPAASGSPVGTILTLKDASEALVTLGLESKWRDVATRVAEIDRVWPTLQPQLRQAGVDAGAMDHFNASLAEVKRQQTARDGRRLAMAANELTAAIPDFLSKFPATLPPELVRLGYEGRKVRFEIEDQSWLAASSTAANIRSTWGRASAELKGPAAGPLGGQGNGSIAQLEQAVTARNVAMGVDAANRLLEQVASLEKAYR